MILEHQVTDTLSLQNAGSTFQHRELRTFNVQLYDADLLSSGQEMVQAAELNRTRNRAGGRGGNCGKAVVLGKTGWNMEGSFSILI